MITIIKSMPAIAAVVAAINFSPISASAHMGGKCMHQTEHDFEIMEKKLRLSTEQKQNIKGVHTKCRAQNELIMKQMGTEQHALKTLTHANTVDDPAIRAQSGKVTAIEKQGN